MTVILCAWYNLHCREGNIFGANKKMISIQETDEYSKWLNNLTQKEQAKVKARISRIEVDEHFGDAKNIGEHLAELRWANGWRVYFSSVGYKKIILIRGGHKNEQEKDIKKARIQLRRLTTR